MKPINKVLLFAAGLGTRMKPLTATRPKSLISISGRPILHHVLDLCKTYPFDKVFVNTHYFHKQVELSINKYKCSNRTFPEITTIYEKELLETGGAIKNAIKIIGSDPIFTINTDAILLANYNIFEDMARRWNPEKMDFLLLLQESARVLGSKPIRGDFNMDSENRIIRPDLEGNYDYVYTGIGILKPEKIINNPLKKFSLRDYYLKNKKIFGVKARKVRWYHASRPEDLPRIEEDMAFCQKMMINKNLAS